MQKVLHITYFGHLFFRRRTKDNYIVQLAAYQMCSQKPNMYQIPNFFELWNSFLWKQLLSSFVEQDDLLLLCHEKKVSKMSYVKNFLLSSQITTDYVKWNMQATVCRFASFPKLWQVTNCLFEIGRRKKKKFILTVSQAL